MCKCREYLNLLYGKCSVLRTYNTIVFEDVGINFLCFALTLQEFIFSNLCLLLSLIKSWLIMSNSKNLDSSITTKKECLKRDYSKEKQEAAQSRLKLICFPQVIVKSPGGAWSYTYYGLTLSPVLMIILMFVLINP